MKRYQPEVLKEQTIGILNAMDSTLENSTIISDVLLSAELRGISSHGIIRLKDYYGLWRSGRLNMKPEINLVHDSPGTGVIDGDNSLGMLSGHKAMHLAIKKAANTGTSWVAVRNSNHYGIAGYYSMMALEHDMIGISMTNANPLVAPTFSTSRLLGTNPIAIAVPALLEPPFVADFATTPIARGKLALMEKGGEKAPYGYVQDEDGNPSTDPSIITRGGAIVPLGGDYLHGSHKGYCLGAIVDILSSVLPGANFGPFVPPQVSYLQPKKEQPGKGLGHIFGAIRIDAFQSATEFKKNMDLWIKTFRSATPSKGMHQVLVPGDPERENEEKNRKSGIELIEKVVEETKIICRELNTPFYL